MNKRFLISLALVATMIATSVVGTLALFTDRESTNTNTNVGNVDIVLDYSSLIVDINGNGEFLPGDAIPMEWTIYNNGSKSSAVRSTLVISYFDENGNPLSISANAPQFLLYPADSNGNFNDTLNPHDYSIDGNTITYTFEDILSGNSSLDVYENESGYASEVDYMNYCYYYLEDYVSGMMTVDIIVEAKQYRNGYNVPWENIQTTRINLSNGDTVNVTPGY